MTDGAEHSIVAEAAAEATAEHVDAAIAASAEAAQSAEMMAASAQATADAAVSDAAEIAAASGIQAQQVAEDAAQTAVAAGEVTVAVAAAQDSHRAEFEAFRDESRAAIQRLESLLVHQQSPAGNGPEVAVVADSPSTDETQGEGESAHERIQRHRERTGHRFGRR